MSALKYLICLSLCFTIVISQDTLIPANGNIYFFKTLNLNRVRPHFLPTEGYTMIAEQTANSQFGKVMEKGPLRKQLFRYKWKIITQYVNEIERCELKEIRADTLFIERRDGWNSTTLLSVSLDDLTGIQSYFLPPMLAKGPGACAGLILGMVIGANLSILINQTYENGQYWLLGGFGGSIVGAYLSPDIFITQYNLTSKSTAEKQEIIESLFP